MVSQVWMGLLTVGCLALLGLFMDRSDTGIEAAARAGVVAVYGRGVAAEGAASRPAFLQVPPLMYSVTTV
jgi:hypothetical protein